MKLVCPACGITASAELWAEDAATRDFIALIVKLPKPVQDELLPYLGLFRPEKRALSMSRARTLTAELLALVEMRAMSFDGKPARPVTPAMWAEAMREMSRKKSGQKAHFANHNYLRAIAWQLADKADAVAEKAKETRLKSMRRTEDREEKTSDGMPPEERAKLVALGLLKP